MNSLRALPSRLLIAIAAFLLLTLFYLGVVLNSQITSDDAAVLLMARSVIDGNLLLRGWTISTLSYYTTELPYYVPGILMFGFSSKLMYVVSALQWALIAALMVYASAADTNGDLSLRKGLIAFCLTLYVATYRAQLDGIVAAGHAPTFAYCLICFLALRWIEDRMTTVGYLVFGSSLVLAAADDTFAFFIIAVPVALVCAARIATRRPRRAAVTLLFSTLASVVVAVAFRSLVTYLGGARVPGVPMGFVPDLQRLGMNAVLLLKGLLGVFGATALADPSLEHSFYLALVRVSGLAVLMLAALPRLVRFRQQSLSVQVLVVIVATNMLEYVGGSVTQPGTVRYVLPSLIFGTILITGFVTEVAFFKERSKAVMIYFLILGLCLIPRLSWSRHPTLLDDLGSFLLRHHLVSGYGPFWTANAVTASTGGKIAVRAVWSPGGKNLQPLHWLSDESWYRSDSNFVVVDILDHSPHAISIDQAIGTFGQPSFKYDVARYKVLVWDADMMSGVGYTYRIAPTGLSVHGDGLWELPRIVGHLGHGELASDGTPGVLVFGPYVAMEPGEYKLTVYGWAEAATTAWVDVVSGTDLVQHAKFPLRTTPAGSTGVLAEGLVVLSAPARDIQVRVYVGANDVVRLTGYDLVGAGP